MNYYSALYIPQEEIKSIPVDNAGSARIKSSLEGALKKANVTTKNYNLTDLSKNMVIMAGTEMTQRYVASAVSKIISGEAITSQTVLDTLFNTYAPAFNGMLEQMGYNNIMQMKNAASAGTINVANFLDGFSKSLSVVTETFLNDSNMEKYGEEIPIDVIAEFKSEYKNEVAVHPYSEGSYIRDYIRSLGEVILKIKAHVYNSAAEIWSIGDFSNKINDAFALKKPIIFRIGKTIYENVIITRYDPTINNIYDIYFELDLTYNNYLGRESRYNTLGYHIINAGVNQEVANMLSTEEYIGEGKVEEVTIEDSAMLEAVKQALNLPKLNIQGQDV